VEQLSIGGAASTDRIRHLIEGNTEFDVLIPNGFPHRAAIIRTIQTVTGTYVVRTHWTAFWDTVRGGRYAMWAALAKERGYNVDMINNTESTTVRFRRQLEDNSKLGNSCQGIS